MARADRSTLVPAIDRLEALGFVKRAVNPDDRRAYALSITAKERSHAAKIVPVLATFEGKLCAAMTDKAKAGLLAALRKIE